MKKRITEPAKAHLSNGMEIMKYCRLKELKAQPKGKDLLNQRNGLISKCRFKNKYKLMNRKT